MIAVRVALLLLAAAALVNGVLGGLARLGPAPAAPMAIAYHGALMIAGFFGTVISLERAVALARPWAYLAPLAAGVGALAWLAGLDREARVLWLVAPLLFVAASAAIVARQKEPHTILLLIAALAWAWGSFLFARGASGLGAAPWWFAFLVLTIAAERLEMTRLMKRRAGAQQLLYALIALLLGGALLSGFHPAGGLAYGAALVGLAAWLLAYDLARRTVRGSGFARYAAVALLSGYGWLALGGVSWAAMPLADPLRDVALHSIGLGFVFSMIFAHAPLIVPVIARVRMRYTPLFYAPLALLDGSLAWRVGSDLLGGGQRYAGAVLNAVAIATFVAILLWSILRRDPPG